MAGRRRPDPSTVRFDGPWTHRDVSANGIRLHLAEAGSGPLVLLLHGFPEFWWTWRHQLAALSSAGYRAAAVDLRGHGDSDKPPRGYDGWTLAADVAGLVRALGEHRATLVGHAWGGLLAWTVAAMHPRLVNGVVPVAAPHPLELRHALHPRRQRPSAGGSGAPRYARWLLQAQLPLLPERRLVADDAALVERLLCGWAGPGWTPSADFEETVRRDRQAMLVPGVAHSSLECVRWAVRAQLRAEGRRFASEIRQRLGVPVLQLHGALDPSMPTTAARRSARWTPAGSRFVELDGAAHFPHQEDPERVSALLADFLAGRE